VFVKAKGFNPEELAQFRKFQKTCFDIQRQMASELTEGITETEVAHKLFRRYKLAGAGNFFHLPVVLFGDRTGLPGQWKLGHFMPKQRRLKQNDAVILDGAPLFDGFMVDTSYSFCFGNNPAHDTMMKHLLEQRVLIKDLVNTQASFRDIAQIVAETGAKLGYDSVHEKHPGEVLGHRALRVRGPQNWRLKGSDGASLSWFLMKIWLSRFFPVLSPLWNRSPASNHAPTDGLWMVEPHFSNGDFGAKWEEILVIQDGQADWLDDKLPHVEKWAA